jgi:hypothetical protein
VASVYVDVEVPLDWSSPRDLVILGGIGLIFCNYIITVLIGEAFKNLGAIENFDALVIFNKVL